MENRFFSPVGRGNVRSIVQQNPQGRRAPSRFNRFMQDANYSIPTSPHIESNLGSSAGVNRPLCEPGGEARRRRTLYWPWMLRALRKTAVDFVQQLSFIYIKPRRRGVGARLNDESDAHGRMCAREIAEDIEPRMRDHIRDTLSAGFCALARALGGYGYNRIGAELMMISIGYGLTQETSKARGKSNVAGGEDEGIGLYGARMWIGRENVERPGSADEQKEKYNDN